MREYSLRRLVLLPFRIVVVAFREHQMDVQVARLAGH